MNNYENLSLSPFRYGGTDNEPALGVSGEYYTPYFLTNVSSQSGSPNINAYLAMLAELDKNISVSAGGVLGANKYNSYAAPAFSIDYKSYFENSPKRHPDYIGTMLPPTDISNVSAGINFTPGQGPGFRVSYGRRF